VRDNSAALFKDVAELREHVLKAFRDFEKKRQGSAPRDLQPSRESQSNETIRNGYVSWLREECEKVVLLGLDLRDRQSVRLGQVYVPTHPAPVEGTTRDRTSQRRTRRFGRTQPRAAPA